MTPSVTARDLARRWPTVPVVSVRVWHAVGAGVSVAVATVGLLASITTGEADRTSLLFYVLAAVLLLVLWAALRRLEQLRRLPGQGVLVVWPLVIVAGLAGSAQVAPVAATLCASTPVLAFLFAGLTQPRGISLVLLLPALLSFRLVYSALPLDQLLVKMAIVALVWIAAAEMPAWLTVRLRLARSELTRLAATDPLTGLANRRRWDEQLGASMARGETPAVLLADLDHFKRFNDEYGHVAGDEMLVAFARTIEQVSPDGDIAARWGGEEFAVLLHDAACAPHIAEQLRRAVPLGQTCSIGLAQHRPGETLGELMRRADAALYRAKEDGRDRVVAA